MQKAEEAGVDLVEVAPNANPPVCRLMDYGKFQYEEKKKRRENRKKQHKVKLKEVQLHPRTEEHDFQTKYNHAVEFLEKGDKVKVVMFFRGREMAHVDQGREQLDRMIKLLTEEGGGKIESPPARMGRRIVATVVPAGNK